mmetsp:Transcript_49518/g.91617  ORF Transcript_49518/g.91617 Transcript_49518/m.91617 type:complete len:793 (-) Transcript_49518:134-2512(-)
MAASGPFICQCGGQRGPDAQPVMEEGDNLGMYEQKQIGGTRFSEFDRAVQAITDEALGKHHEDRHTLEWFVRTQCARLLETKEMKEVSAWMQKREQAAIERQEANKRNVERILEIKEQQHQDTFVRMKVHQTRMISAMMAKLGKADDEASMRLIFLLWRAQAHAELQKAFCSRLREQVVAATEASAKANAKAAKSARRQVSSENDPPRNGAGHALQAGSRPRPSPKHSPMPVDRPVLQSHTGSLTTTAVQQPDSMQRDYLQNERQDISGISTVTCPPVSATCTHGACEVRAASRESPLVHSGGASLDVMHMEQAAQQNGEVFQQLRFMQPRMASAPRLPTDPLSAVPTGAPPQLTALPKSPYFGEGRSVGPVSLSWGSNVGSSSSEGRLSRESGGASTGVGSLVGGRPSDGAGGCLMPGPSRSRPLSEAESHERISDPCCRPPPMSPPLPPTRGMNGNVSMGGVSRATSGRSASPHRLCGGGSGSRGGSPRPGGGFMSPRHGGTASPHRGGASSPHRGRPVANCIGPADERYGYGVPASQTEPMSRLVGVSRSMGGAMDTARVQPPGLRPAPSRAASPAQTNTGSSATVHAGVPSIIPPKMMQGPPPGSPPQHGADVACTAYCQPGRREGSQGLAQSIPGTTSPPVGHGSSKALPHLGGGNTSSAVATARQSPRNSPLSRPGRPTSNTPAQAFMRHGSSASVPAAREMPAATAQPSRASVPHGTTGSAWGMSPAGSFVAPPGGQYVVPSGERPGRREAPASHSYTPSGLRTSPHSYTPGGQYVGACIIRRAA